jgi:chromate transporter
MPHGIPSRELACTFLRIGALSFGGLGATLALIEHELVVRRAVLSRAEIADALTHTKLLPGSTVVQVVAYLGWRLAGWRGSALATISFLLPSATMMAALAYGYLQVATLPAIVGVRRGVVAVVVALLLVTMSRLAQQVVTNRLTRGLAVGAFFVVLLFPNASSIVVIAAGVVGVAWSRRVPT